MRLNFIIIYRSRVIDESEAILYALSKQLAVRGKTLTAPSLKSVLRLSMKVWGVYRERVTPVPIPNTEVKPLIGDDTARVAAWESSTMPH